MSEKTEEMKKAEAIKNIEDLATAKANEIATKAIEDLKSEIATQKEEAKTANEESVKAINKSIAELQAKLKKSEQTKTKEVMHKDSVKAMVSAFGEIIRETNDAQKSHEGGTVILANKAIAVADFGGQAGYDLLTTDVSMPMYVNPYAPTYLRNIFPNRPTTSKIVTNWKKTGVEGAASEWVSGSGAKPEIKPIYEKENVEVGWIAATTTVDREMLDDVAFLSTDIPNTIIYSEEGLMAKENAKILAYLALNSTSFADADLKNGLEELLGAAFKLTGQYMTPTHMLINTQDYLKKIVLNKATGSGEYDTPDGKVSFIGGQMFINNLIAVPTPGMAESTAYVIDANQSVFLNRMNIELKMSEEHGTNFTENKVTFRGEERVGFYTKNVLANLKVDLTVVGV
jgi:HK97 family phage major capsid protein